MILTLANSKGGTGKSTSVAALAQAATYTGIKTLVIDADPQGNASHILRADTARAGLYEVLEGRITASEAIQSTTTGPDALAASWSLQDITSSQGSAWRLKRALEPVKKRYRLIIIDTPPTAGELQDNALLASNQLIVPLSADILSLQGLYQMADTAQDLQQANPTLKIKGYILTRHGGRSTIARQMAQTIEAEAAERGIPFLGAIRQAVAIQEAQALQMNLYEYAPNSNPAQDYMNLLNILIK